MYVPFAVWPFRCLNWPLEFLAARNSDIADWAPRPRLKNRRCSTKFDCGPEVARVIDPEFEEDGGTRVADEGTVMSDEGTVAADDDGTVVADKGTVVADDDGTGVANDDETVDADGDGPEVVNDGRAADVVAVVPKMTGTGDGAAAWKMLGCKSNA